MKRKMIIVAIYAMLIAISAIIVAAAAYGILWSIGVGRSTPYAALMLFISSIGSVYLLAQIWE